MDRRTSLTIYKDEIDQAKQIAEIINSTLGEDRGVSFKFDTNNRDGSTMLIVYTDDEKIRRSKSRNAGRKLAKQVKTITCGEVEELLQNNKNDDVADQLGYTRATFYRKLRQARRHKEPDRIF